MTAAHDAPRATDHALAVAEQAVTVETIPVPHGDNRPDWTAELLVDRAVVDRQFPPVGETPGGQPMCWAWDPTCGRYGCITVGEHQHEAVSTDG